VVVTKRVPNFVRLDPCLPDVAILIKVILRVRHVVAARSDTTAPHGRLMLTVLGGLAEFERELIRARTGEGRKRAKECGVRFGRPPKLTPHSARYSGLPMARRRRTLRGPTRWTQPR
jgi:DNA invertase Pin-like site-specific DNA recombinase